MASKILVTYFSATGTTARLAERIAQVAGADLCKIEPADPYTSADLNWNDRGSRSSVEMNDEFSRPELLGDAPDTSAYDAILVGFPIWWYVEPRIVDTFLEACDLGGKTVVPFATSGGSSMGKTGSRIQSLCPDAKVTGAKRLAASASAAEIESWLSGLGLL